MLIPGAEHLMAIVRREVERTMRHLHKPPRLGLVSQYDKKQHAVKIQFQPEGTLSGWIPLTAMAIGNKFGVLFAPNIKDQVEVQHQEGDHMVARVMTRHFSQKADVPPEIEAGEYHLIHGSGAVIRFLKDGTVQIGGGKTVDTGDIGKGKSGNLTTGNQGQTQDQSQQGQQQQPEKPDAKQLVTLKPNGDMTTEVPKGKHSLTAKSVSREATDSDITDKAKGNHSRSAQKNITDTAQAIGHNGPTSVTGTLGVSQIVTALNYTTSSDRRIKTGLRRLRKVFELAMDLPLWRFNVHEAHMNANGFLILEPTSIPSVGVIAQEMRDLFPELVHGDEKVEPLSVQEGKIGVIALAALQEYVSKQDADMSELRSRITELESQVSEKN